jgi:hypothetical protein
VVADHSGLRLFETVRAYARLGDHRTGGAVDRATRAWAADILQSAGGRVSEQPFRFPHYDADWRVEIGGRRIDSLPLFYCTAGETDLANVPLVRVPFRPGEEAAGLRAVEQAAAKATGALIVVSETATGGLYALNCEPREHPTGPAIFVVGSDDVRGFDVTDNHVFLRATVTQGETANLMADFGPAGQRPRLTISTPMTGWFACAGERGSGLAIAFAVAERLAGDFPLRLVLSSGHEVGHIGLDVYLAATAPAPDEAILHVGAGVAAGSPGADGRFRLTPDIRLTAHATAHGLDRMARAMAAIGVPFTQAQPAESPASWRGEARNWAPRARRMASLVGFSPFFHERDDQPERVTDAALLTSVCDAVEDIARALAEPANG